MTVPVYTAFNSSWTKKRYLLSVDEVLYSHLNVGQALGERIVNTRSLHLNNSAYEYIINTFVNSFHSTRIQLSSAPSEIESHASTHCRIKYLNLVQ